MERFRFDKGFTLVEIIVAIAVVGIVGVAFAGFFINSARMISAVDEREKAIMIAQTEMEELKAVGYENIDSSDYPKEHGGYKIKLQLAPDTPPQLYIITIRVEWDDNKNLELVSYISEG